MHEPGICPHCGYALKNDEVIERGDWTLDPRGDTRFQNMPVSLRPAHHSFLHSVAAMAPRIVPEHVLLERLDISNDNTLKVQVSLLRKALREAGVPSPFETAWGRGYRWTADTPALNRNPSLVAAA